MKRFVWTTLLALSAWLSASAERRHASSPSALAAVALDTPARPAAPSAHDALALLRQLALRTDGRQHARHLGGPLLAAAPAARVGAPVRALAAFARREPPHTAKALAFPYDATAPPPAPRA